MAPRARCREYKSFEQLQKYSPPLEMMLFPCRQFGAQEFEDASKVVEFAENKNFKGAWTKGEERTMEARSEAIRILVSSLPSFAPRH